MTNNSTQLDTRKHSFHVGLAKDFGVDVALFIDRIAFMTEINLGNKRNINDGYCWTYDNLEALQASFPYYSIKQIRRIINNCIEYNLIKKSNYNKAKYDRTNWYCLTAKGCSYFPHLYNFARLTRDKLLISNICPNGQMDLPKWANGSAQMGTPIPDTDTDTDTDSRESKRAHEPEQNETTSSKPEPVANDWENHTALYEQDRSQPIDHNACPAEKNELMNTTTTGYDVTAYEQDSFEHFWQLYPRKIGKERAKAQWFHDGCQHIHETIIEKLKAQIAKDKAFLEGYVPNPHKYIMEKRYNDEVFTGSKTSSKPTYDNQDTSWIHKKDIFDQV